MHAIVLTDRMKCRLKDSLQSAEGMLEIVADWFSKLLSEDDGAPDSSGRS